MERDRGARIHVKFKHREGGEKQLDYQNATGWTHVYDVGLEELEALRGEFPDTEIVSFGRFAGTDSEEEARGIVG